MKIAFTDSPDSEILTILVEKGSNLNPAAQELDASIGGLLTEALASARFEGNVGEQISMVLPKSAAANRAILVGYGGPDRDARALEKIGAHIYKASSMSGFENLDIMGADAGDAARIALGVMLAAYRFDEYRTTLKADKKPSLKHVSMVVSDVATEQAAFAPLAAAADGTYLARDLVNMPPNDLHPESYADKILELTAHGLDVEILGEAEMAKLGMNALLGVGQGSVRESKLGIIKWNGLDNDADPVALVGKGVCFDTGGVSLKPGAGMEAMRGDMGGSAAVVGTMLALAKRKAKVNVVGLVGLVENMPDGNAIRPGDILTSASGQTIEVQNTDAEGRLVLCDVLWYTQQNFNPVAIVDLATLTGATVIGLGYHHAGLFSNDDQIAAALFEAGQDEGERVWRMPLGPEYDRQLKSEFADMRNIGGRSAGSITAAQFLQRFIDDGVKWAHIDIAGTAWVEVEKSPIDPSWASGFGPRLLDRWIANNYES